MSTRGRVEGGNGGRSGLAGAGSDQELIVAAARAVLAALREPLEQRALPSAAIGALQLLECALDKDRDPPQRRG